MSNSTTKLCQARPRLDYTAHLSSQALTSRTYRKASKSRDGVHLIRCGGGYRVVKRGLFAGEERRSV